jgi:hypothetical protein
LKNDMVVSFQAGQQLICCVAMARAAGYSFRQGSPTFDSALSVSQVFRWSLGVTALEEIPCGDPNSECGTIKERRREYFAERNLGQPAFAVAAGRGSSNRAEG